ncbi:MAG: hypothetical protein C0625_01320 [Arcobacter sp.]|nr:MAG: hypothetical protein C0625_01320 [Arcobacter sp.]
MRSSQLLFSFFLVFFITACGYKPSSQYAKEQLKGKIFVNLIIDLQDPRNAVLIKDAMNEIIIHRLDSKIVYDKSIADTIMDIKLNSVTMTVLQDDASGYNKLYKAVVSIYVKYTNKKKSDSFDVTGDYDFSIDDGTTITDTKRFEAIKNAATKALEEVISKIAVSSFKKK